MTEAVAGVGYDFCLPEIGRICHVEDLKRLETELGVTVHLQQSRAGRPLEILELGAGLSLPGFVAALLGVRYWDYWDVDVDDVMECWDCGLPGCFG